MITADQLHVGALYIITGKTGRLRQRKLVRYNPAGKYAGGTVTVVTMPANGLPGGTVETHSADYFCQRADLVQPSNAR